MREIPHELYRELRNVWDNHYRQSSEREQLTDEYPEGSNLNSYLNTWEAPTRMMKIQKYIPFPYIYASLQPILEEWSGTTKQQRSATTATTTSRLSEAAIYGIRVYYNGSILAPHVDFMPRVISAILNIDQDVHEAWPLEIYDHDGMPFNTTIEPGEMIVYESATLIHGR